MASGWTKKKKQILRFARNDTREAGSGLGESRRND